MEGGLSLGGKVFKQQDKFIEIQTAVVISEAYTMAKYTAEEKGDAEEAAKMKELADEAEKKADALIDEGFVVTDDVLLTETGHIKVAHHIERKLKKAGQWYDGIEPVEEEMGIIDHEEFYKFKESLASVYRVTLKPINNNNN